MKTILAITVLLLVASTCHGQGACVRTEHFQVCAPNAVLAREVAETCEAWLEHHRIWFGLDGPAFRGIAQVKVVVVDNRGGGSTGYIIQDGVPEQVTASWQGLPKHLVEDVIPHEVSHLVAAARFRRYLPRWLDEGVAVHHESDESRTFWASQSRNYQLPLTTLWRSTRYGFEDGSGGDEWMAPYCQGSSIVEFLLRRSGKDKFLQFVDHDLDPQVLGFGSVEQLEGAWLAWRADGSERRLEPRTAWYRPMTEKHGAGCWMTRGGDGKFAPFGGLLRDLLSGRPQAEQPRPQVRPAPSKDAEPIATFPQKKPEPEKTTGTAAQPDQNAPASARPRPVLEAAGAATGLLGNPWVQTAIAAAAGGLSGGTAPLALAGLRLLGGLWRRRARRGSTTLQQDVATAVGGGASAPSFQAAVRRDAKEAADICALLNVEGQNPHLLAYLGAALGEELDRELAGTDEPRKQWAAELKQRLTDRVNQTCPVLETLAGA